MNSQNRVKSVPYMALSAALLGCALFFAVTLWRVELSPDTEFDLIHEEFASYSIEGECLADISKAHDAELSIFGHIERFSITP